MTAMLGWGWRRCDCGEYRARGSGTVSSAADLLVMSVVRGMRGVGGVCERIMCLSPGGVGGEGLRGLGMGFTNPVGTGCVLDVCLGCSGV